MTLRIGFDMDGVLADLATAYHEAEARLFAPGTAVTAENIGKASIADRRSSSGVTSTISCRTSAVLPADNPHPIATAGSPLLESMTRDRQSDAIWASIRATPDFWLTLKPITPGAVRRLNDLMREHGWEVFFI